jgi:hypothetical protein
MIKLGRRSILRGSLGLAAAGVAAQPYIAIARAEEDSNGGDPNILIYEGALLGQGTGSAVNGSNVPFVNGKARVIIDLSKSTVVGRLGSDVFVAQFNDLLEGWLDVESKGTFSAGAGTYSFNSLLAN